MGEDDRFGFGAPRAELRGDAARPGLSGRGDAARPLELCCPELAGEGALSKLCISYVGAIGGDLPLRRAEPEPSPLPGPLAGLPPIRRGETRCRPFVIGLLLPGFTTFTSPNSNAESPATATLNVWPGRM